ncbi:MAG: hypothetical protein ABIO49_08215, partial [Dokdonella sp.]
LKPLPQKSVLKGVLAQEPDHNPSDALKGIPFKAACFSPPLQGEGWERMVFSRCLDRHSGRLRFADHAAWERLQPRCFCLCGERHRR